MGKQVVIKGNRTVAKDGVYEFTEEELDEKAKAFHRLTRKKNEILAEKKTANDKFKAKESEINEELNILDNDLSTQRRQGEFECIIYLEKRDKGWFKIFESKEHGHKVSEYPFDFDKDKHLFDFKIERDTENAVKKVFYEGELVMTVAMSLDELQMRIDDLKADRDEPFLGEEEEEVMEEDPEEEEFEEEDDDLFPPDNEEEEEGQ